MGWGKLNTAFPGRRTRTRADSRARCATDAAVDTAGRAEAKTWSSRRPTVHAQRRPQRQSSQQPAPKRPRAAYMSTVLRTLPVSANDGSDRSARRLADPRSRSVRALPSTRYVASATSLQTTRPAAPTATAQTAYTHGGDDSTDSGFAGAGADSAACTRSLRIHLSLSATVTQTSGSGALSRMSL